MNPQTISLVGSGIGVVGALIGSYLTIKNTKASRERKFAIHASILCWILVMGFVTVMFWIPTWHRHLLWIPYAILLNLGIRVWNKTQFRIYREESGDAA